MSGKLLLGLCMKWLEWSDWENDNIEIPVDTDNKVTIRITWNKRMIIEDTFHNDSTKNGLISKTKTMNSFSDKVTENVEDMLDLNSDMEEEK